MLSSVLPYPLGCVVLRAVRWKQKHLYTTAILLVPVKHFRFLVIGGIVLNEVDAALSLVEGRQQCPLEKGDVRFRVEVDSLMPILEPCIE